MGDEYIDSTLVAKEVIEGTSYYHVETEWKNRFFLEATRTIKAYFENRDESLLKLIIEEDQYTEGEKLIFKHRIFIPFLEGKENGVTIRWKKFGILTSYTLDSSYPLFNIIGSAACIVAANKHLYDPNNKFLLFPEEVQLQFIERFRKTRKPIDSLGFTN